jgi:hypothetical protein
MFIKQLRSCRDDWIRTSDLVVPNDARYRAALHPELDNMGGCQKPFLVPGLEPLKGFEPSTC